LGEPPNPFELVTIVLKRSVQLSYGAEPLVFPRTDEPVVTTAMREIARGKIGWKLGDK
jgi:DNA-directed RNA polymerase omega subunit